MPRWRGQVGGRSPAGYLPKAASRRRPSRTPGAFGPTGGGRGSAGPRGAGLACRTAHVAARLPGAGSASDGAASSDAECCSGSARCLRRSNATSQRTRADRRVWERAQAIAYGGVRRLVRRPLMLLLIAWLLTRRRRSAPSTYRSVYLPEPAVDGQRLHRPHGGAWHRRATPAETLASSPTASARSFDHCTWKCWWACCQQLVNGILPGVATSGAGPESGPSAFASAVRVVDLPAVVIVYRGPGGPVSSA